MMKLLDYYDFVLNLDFVVLMVDIYDCMDCVVSFVDWVIYVFYVKVINDLKCECNVVVLVYNYMILEIFYGIFDVLGDSLQLVIEVIKVDVDVIV